MPLSPLSLACSSVLLAAVGLQSGAHHWLVIMARPFEASGAQVLLEHLYGAVFFLRTGRCGLAASGRLLLLILLELALLVDGAGALGLFAT